MEERPELFTKKLKPWLHLMDEGHTATGYVIEGDDKVCVIDTMCGFSDIKSYIRSFTDKPVMVINTHGHGDHILGNIYFDEAYMNSRDLELADLFIKSPEAVKEFEKHGVSMPPFKPVKEGDVFDDTIHEAVAAVPNSGNDKNTIIFTQFKGYKMGDTILRYAKVAVAV